MEITHAVEDCEFFSPSCHPASFWLYLGMSIALVMFAGLMGGLTMGLVSLDMLNMRILEMEGSEVEKQRAARVIPIISRHHLLLVTLLLGNACANEALPIFLSKLVPESVSIIISVTCVLMFGEIIPSAIFTGPNQLRIASALTPFMRAFMTVASPISYPIAKFLDWWLGADHDIARYKRQELKALVALQRETEVLQHTVRKARRSRRRKQNRDHDDIDEDDDEDHVDSDYTRFDDGEEPYDHTSARRSHDFSHQTAGQSSRLHVDEVTIIHGALDLTAKTVRTVMIPMEQVYMLQYDTKLSDNVMADILASGHSRIPIFRYHPSNIVGLLLVKRLIVVDPEDERPVHDLALRKPIVVSPEESCYYVLNEFQKGHSHIAVVTKDAKLVKQCWQDGVDIPESVQFDGIITIEDIIEELIQEEIEDESDMYVHDVVGYWKAKAARDASNAEAKASGSNLFVQQRLRVLAERARTRVRSRKTKKRASCPPTSSQMEPTIEVRIVADDQPAPNAA